MPFSRDVGQVFSIFLALSRKYFPAQTPIFIGYFCATAFAITIISHIRPSHLAITLGSRYYWDMRNTQATNAKAETMNDAYNAAIAEAAEHITSGNCSTILAGIDAAYVGLLKSPFAVWCKNIVGATVYGTKKEMRQQARSFVNRLAVTDTQCDF